MIAGHFGLAAGIKAKEPQAPLWSLMLATVWLDILFIPLLVTGVETIETIGEGGYGQAVIHADYTHSLVGALILSGLLGAFFGRRWTRRTGIVLGVVAFSHWVLDLVVHRHDLVILPGDAGDLPRLGFGLWRSTAGSVVVELAIVVVGSLLYWRAAVRTAGDADAPTRRRARMLGPAVLAAGLVTLLIDVFLG